MKLKLKDMPNTISVAEATIWFNRWMDSDKKIDKKGFFIPGSDLTDVMAEEGVVDSRAYMAIDNDGEHHLLIVGVDAAGNDMLDEEAGQHVYDFTRPCPVICSATGPFK